MKERPILFSGPMVRAILAGEKTQTRRVCKKAHFPGDVWADAVCPARETGWIAWEGAVQPGEALAAFTQKQYREGFPCPYGQPGDRLWVRETFLCAGHDAQGRFVGAYRADEEDAQKAGDAANPKCRYDTATWRPSIFMPRALSRITLEVVRVRVERVQDISDEDALAEGLTFTHYSPIKQGFHWLWDDINEARGYGWAVNPWVWVIEFKRV